LTFHYDFILFTRTRNKFNNGIYIVNYEFSEVRLTLDHFKFTEDFLKALQTINYNFTRSFIEFRFFILCYHLLLIFIQFYRCIELFDVRQNEVMKLLQHKMPRFSTSKQYVKQL